MSDLDITVDFICTIGKLTRIITKNIEFKNFDIPNSTANNKRLTNLMKYIQLVFVCKKCYNGIFYVKNCEYKKFHCDRCHGHDRRLAHTQQAGRPQIDPLRRFLPRPD